MYIYLFKIGRKKHKFVCNFSLKSVNMSAFGFGELPDSGGSGNTGTKKPVKSLAPRNTEDDHDHRLKQPRGELPRGTRGKAEMQV